MLLVREMKLKKLWYLPLPPFITHFCEFEFSLGFPPALGLGLALEHRCNTSQGMLVKETEIKLGCEENWSQLPMATKAIQSSINCFHCLLLEMLAERGPVFTSLDGDCSLGVLSSAGVPSILPNVLFSSNNEWKQLQWSNSLLSAQYCSAAIFIHSAVIISLSFPVVHFWLQCGFTPLKK